MLNKPSVYHDFVWCTCDRENLSGVLICGHGHVPTVMLSRLHSLGENTGVCTSNPMSCILCGYHYLDSLTLGRRQRALSVAEYPCLNSHATRLTGKDRPCYWCIKISELRYNSSTYWNWKSSPKLYWPSLHNDLIIIGAYTVATESTLMYIR